jgi:hypothetical protein
LTEESAYVKGGTAQTSSFNQSEQGNAPEAPASRQASRERGQRPAKPDIKEGSISMSKKILAVCTALVAFAAFSVMATAASANPVVTHPTGTVMATHPAGTTCTAEPKGCITGTQINSPSKFTSGSTDPGTPLVECSNATMTGELDVNSTTATPSITGNITTADFSGTGASVNGVPECTSSFGNVSVVTTGANGVPWCLTSVKATDEFEVRGGLCTEAARKIAFNLNSTTAGECKYEKESFKGTFVTHPEDAVLTLTHAGPAAKVAGGILCPASGSLDMSFTLETDSGTVSPVYLSS